MSDVETVIDRTLENQDAPFGARDLTHIQRAQKLEAITKLALRGYPVRQIAYHPTVNMKESTVAAMIRSVKAEWLEMAREDVVKLRAKEIAKIDHIEQEAWEAWERSKESKRRDQVNAEVNVGKDGKVKRTPRASRTVQEDRVGDPRYLDIVFRCIEKRVRILGIIDENAASSIGDINGELNSLEIRVSRYVSAGVLNDGIVGTPQAIADYDDSGEPMDSARSAPKTGDILDLDESQWAAT